MSSSFGPQLPTNLATKRKRTPEKDNNDDSHNGSSAPSPNKHPRRHDAAATIGPSLPAQNNDEIDLGSGSDSDDLGPKVPFTSIPASARVSGPSPPPRSNSNSNSNNNQDEIDLDNDSDSDSDTGPAPPPASRTTGPQLPPSTTNPTSPPSSDSDSDSDSFGPSLPSASTSRRPIGPSLPSLLPDQDAAPKRDEWMLAPPPSSTTFSERDTTRIRARKFSSKPASGSGSTPNNSNNGTVPSIWTETPEQKLKRLQDAVLGRSAPADAPNGGTQPLDAAALKRQKKQQERDAAISASIQAQRGKSLLEEHQSAAATTTSGRGKTAATATTKFGEEEEDDPSKRAFDREKDMALGGRINATQRRELVNKSANFAGRFQKGSYL